MIFATLLKSIKIDATMDSYEYKYELGGVFLAYKLLLVDNNGNELKKIISVLEKEYEIYTALSSKEALDMLNRLQIDIIFLDIRIDELDGESLLQRIKDRFPNVIRIILGLYAEDPQLLDAIQKNLAKTSILTPWEENILELTNKIFKSEEHLKRTDLFKHFKNLNELPTIKISYRKVLQLIDNDSEMDAISDAISADPSMTSKLLRIVNSAYYGVRTTSVKHAVTYLGTVNIRDLVLSTSVFDVFNKSDVPETIYQPLWQQAFVSSKIVSAAYRIMKKHIPSYASLSGLMMNIGVVFLLSQFGARYTKIIQSVKQQSGDNRAITLDSLELKEFGISHQEIGGNLLSWWDIPFPFVEAALYHHDPFNENIIDKELLCILHIAEHYSSKTIFMDSDMNYVDECFRYLKINKDLFEDRISEI